MNELLKILKVQTPKKARKKIIEIMSGINMKTKLSDFGIDNDGIEIKIKNGSNPQRMKNNPKVLSELDLRNLIEKIL